MELTKSVFLRIDNIAKRYGGAQGMALRGINLSVCKGEFFGLLGPNGSGKTTLISIICGLLRATTGRVLLDNKQLPEQLREIKPLIGLVPQELALYPTLTVKENLYFFGHLYGLKGKRLKQRVEACVETARLEAFYHKQINTFSGGMKRRANIVIALLHEPKLIILDEPTVNVDPQSREVIFTILKDINQHGATMLYTTHYLEEAEELCHRIAIIDNGKVITVGTPRQLIASHVGCHDLGEVFLHLTGRHLRD